MSENTPSYNGAAAKTYGMPRQQEPKYGIDLTTGQLVNRQTGKPIPPSEPLFILRGQDKLALQTLQAYRQMLAATGCDASSIDERLLAFSAFANAHPEVMKYPGPEQAPTTMNPQAVWPFPNRAEG